MKRIFSSILAFAAITLCASTCDKMNPGDYCDSSGKKINLLGGWTLSEIQIRTAGVIENHEAAPESVMEFGEKGVGFTKSVESGGILDTWHYEIYRAAVVIFTEEEWERNRGLGEDDSEYQQGKTYYFHVIDDNTISSEDKSGSNTVITSIFSRYDQELFSQKISDDGQFSPKTLIISYDKEVGKGPLLKAIKDYGAEIIYDYSIIPGMAIRIPEGKDIHDAIDYFKKVKGVVSVERDRIYHLDDES